MLGSGNYWTVELIQYRTSLQEQIDRLSRDSAQDSAIERIRLTRAVNDFEIGDLNASELLAEFARIRHGILRSRHSVGPRA